MELLLANLGQKSWVWGDQTTCYKFFELRDLNPILHLPIWFLSPKNIPNYCSNPLKNNKQKQTNDCPWNEIQAVIWHSVSASPAIINVTLLPLLTLLSTQSPEVAFKQPWSEKGSWIQAIQAIPRFQRRLALQEIPQAEIYIARD